MQLLHEVWTTCSPDYGRFKLASLVVNHMFCLLNHMEELYHYQREVRRVTARGRVGYLSTSRLVLQVVRGADLGPDVFQVG